MVDGRRLYVLLPPSGFLDEEMRTITTAAPSLRALSDLSPSAAETASATDQSYDFVDSIADAGPMVVSMTTAAAKQARNQPGGVRIAQVRHYRPAIRPFRAISRLTSFTRGSTPVQIRVQVLSANDQSPLEGATVIAILDQHTRQGIRRRTGKRGLVTLTFPQGTSQLDELFVYPPDGFWGYYEANKVLAAREDISLNPIDLSADDYLRKTYAPASSNAGLGVTVAVVDSGVAQDHPDLNVVGGENFAPDGDPSDFGPGTNHGTHVAGIIAGRGALGTGMVGVAPQADIRSYRVFPKSGGPTSNVEIAKAIYRAVQDDCDIINLSLGGGLSDPVLNEAIGYAFEHGVVCIVAAGNDGRKPVSYPAWFKRAIAVSALGHEETIPTDSTEIADIDVRSRRDPMVFLAAFSNIGREIDFAGPGVGIVSTVPGGYAVMSGTSMACPAVSGAAAVVLSQTPSLLNAPPDLNRSLAVMESLRSVSSSAGFLQQIEGFGLPQP